MTEKLPRPQREYFPQLLEEHLKFITTEQVLGRVYSRGGPYPANWNTFRTWGPTGSRFDHHPSPCRDHPRRGVIYGASHSTDPNYELLVTCLLERFQITRAVNRYRDDPHFATHRPVRQLRLLDLSSVWIAAARGNGAISSGDREMARRWSKAIYHHYSAANAVYLDKTGEIRSLLIDGLWYPCSLLSSRNSMVLYERAANALPQSPILDVPLADSAFDRVMDKDLPRVGLELVDASTATLFSLTTEAA